MLVTETATDSSSSDSSVGAREINKQVEFSTRSFLNFFSSSSSMETQAQTNYGGNKPQDVSQKLTLDPTPEVAVTDYFKTKYEERLVKYVFGRFSFS